MDDDGTNAEWNDYLRKQLSDMFGTYDEFSERLAKGLKHGLSRSKLKVRTGPFAPLQSVQDSPSHVPVHVALQSMRTLIVEEPLSALPNDLMSLKSSTMSPATTSRGTSGKGQVEVKSGSKRRFDGNGEKQLEPRRKKVPNSDSHRDEDDFPFSPDSGVHSTENEMTDESATVETMLSIMTSLEEPQISPLPEHFVKKEEKVREKEKHKESRSARKEKEKEKEEKPQKKSREKSPKKERKKEAEAEKKVEKEKEKMPVPKVTLRFPDGSTTSSASTSRDVSPEVRPRHQKSSATGHLKLDVLKSDRLKKLIKLADSRGKLGREDGAVKEERPSSSENGGRTSSRASIKLEPPSRTQTPESSTPRKQPTQPPSREKDKEKEKSRGDSRSETPIQNSSQKEKALNKTVHHLTADAKPSPSTTPRSIGGSSMNTPTLLSRPSSSLSTHDPAAASSSQSINKRWTCQWEHSKAKTIQRVPIPDPTVPNQKSKGDFYRDLAREWKSNADKSKDKVIRPLNYMMASVYFVMEALAKAEKERTMAARMQCITIYRDTHELLGVAISQGIRETDDPLAAHMLPRVKILGQIMLSVMQYQMYVLRAEQAMKTYTRLESQEVAAHIETHPTNGSTSTAPDSSTSQGWTASLTNSSHSVTMPQVVYNMMRTQMKTTNALMLASRYWEDAKLLTKQIDERFVKHHETVCGRSIGMDTAFDQLAAFVLTAVGSLKAEYEEELRLPVRPVLAKMKPVLEIAVKLGAFHSTKGDRSNRTSQSTPRLTTATSTPQSSAQV